MRAFSRLIFIGAVMVAVTMPEVISADPGTHSPSVNRRERRQGRRVRRGVKSGELTPAEAKSLRQEQRGIRKEEREMKSDGSLTGEERKELQQDLNKSSEHIKQEKHDSQTR